MLKRTHLVFGLFIFLVVFTFFSPPQPLWIFLLVMLGSMLPDIDIIMSWLGRKGEIASFFGHRGIVHSLPMLILLSLIIFLLSQTIWFALAFALGFLGHLLLDTLTYQGIRPLGFGWRVKGFVKSGGITDLVLFIVFFAASGLLVLWSLLHTSLF